MRRTLVFALVAACGAPPEEGPSTCAIEAPARGPLHTDGTHLRDAAGRRVLLRGVNAGGRSKFDPYLPFDVGPDGFDAALAVYLDRAASWGIDALRVPFSWQAMEPVPGQDDEAWLARYDALLDGAAVRGLWTIVDFHQDIYAEPFCGDGFPSWTLADPDPGPSRHDCSDWFMAYFFDPRVSEAWDDFWSDATGARTAMRAMWRRMAARHADRPGVVGFEIVNEPHGGTGDEDLWAREVLTPFYAELAELLHEEDPDALVFFDSSGVDAATATSAVERPEGRDLVFAPHFYDGGIFLTGATGAGLPPAEGMARWAEKGAELGVPVLVGEFGTLGTDPNAAAYLRAHYDAFDAHELSATLWEYSTAAELWNFENLGLTEADGAEREAMVDAMARPFAVALAGDDLVFAFEADAERAVLEGDAEAGGVSEIAVPRWRYGGDFEVDVEGGCVDVRDDRVLVRADGGALRLEVRGHR